MTFATQIVVGTGIFLMIIASAVLLDLLATWLGTVGVSALLVRAIKFVEILIYVGDLASYLVFFANVSWRHWKSYEW